jgi:hypothetical protein
LNYGYFINKHQFGWPAPDEEAWQACSQTFIGWPVCKGKIFNKNPGSFLRFIKNAGSFFRVIKNPGSVRIPVHFSASFLRLNGRNADSFLTLAKIVYDADFFELKIPVFMLYYIVMLPETRY